MTEPPGRHGASKACRTFFSERDATRQGSLGIWEAPVFELDANNKSDAEILKVSEADGFFRMPNADGKCLNDAGKRPGPILLNLTKPVSHNLSLVSLFFIFAHT